MNRKIKEIVKYHKEWIEIAKCLGAGDYSEDLIQEAYIKIDKYNYQDKIIKDGKVSKGYMFFIIRSLFVNYVNAKNKIKKVDYNPNDFKSFKLYSSDLTKELAFGRLCDKMDKELNNLHWYDKRIFEIYRDTPLSIRGIAKETQISFVNIFHTLKKVKAVMKDKFNEDYQDYVYGDYDRI